MTLTRTPLAQEIVRRVDRGEWAVIGLTQGGSIPIGLHVWCYEEFGVTAHDLVLAIIVDKGGSHGETCQQDGSKAHASDAKAPAPS